MCGRYSLYEYNELPNRFKFEDDLFYKPSYNIAPSQNAPVIIRQTKNLAKLMKWGLIPFWAKDPRIGFKMINARAETVATAPSYRVPFSKQRCLIPANGFYEWKTAGKVKEPHYIKRKDNELFAMAGLFDVWKDAEGYETWSYTIITTEPNEIMSSIHKRMPVILDKEDEDLWLDVKTTPDNLQNLLKPADNDLLVEHIVSTTVNSPSNNSPILIEPINPQ